MAAMIAACAQAPITVATVMAREALAAVRRAAAVEVAQAAPRDRTAAAADAELITTATGC